MEISSGVYLLGLADLHWCFYEAFNEIIDKNEAGYFRGGTKFVSMIQLASLCLYRNNLQIFILGLGVIIPWYF